MSDVPPPPPPPAMPPPPAAGGGGTSFQVGEPINYGFKRFMAAPVPWILLMLIVFAGIAVAQILFLFVVFPLADNFFVYLIVNGFFTVVFMAVVYALQYGVIRAALGATEGRAPNFGEAWKMDEFGNYAITSLLVGVIVGVGFFLCFIPGVIAAFLLFLAPYFAADKKLAPMDAIKASIDVTKNNVGSLLLAAIVIGLVYWLGIVVCCIGVLATGPIAVISIAWVYKRITGQDIAPIEAAPAA